MKKTTKKNKKTVKKVIKEPTKKIGRPKKVPVAPELHVEPDVLLYEEPIFTRKERVIAKEVVKALQAPLYEEPIAEVAAYVQAIENLQKASYDANGTFIDFESPGKMTVSEEQQLEEYLENLKKDRLVLANSNKSWITKFWEFLAQLFPNW